MKVLAVLFLAGAVAFGIRGLPGAPRGDGAFHDFLLRRGNVEGARAWFGDRGEGARRLFARLALACASIGVALLVLSFLIE